MFYTFKILSEKSFDQHYMCFELVQFIFVASGVYITAEL